MEWKQRREGERGRERRASKVEIMRGTTEGGSDQGCECSGNCDFDAPVRGREDPAQCRLSSAVIHFHAFTTCLRLRQMLSISRRLGKWSQNLQPCRPPPSDAKPPRREKGNMPRPSIYGLCSDELPCSLAVVPHPHYGKSVERRRDVEN